MKMALMMCMGAQQHWKIEGNLSDAKYILIYTIIPCSNGDRQALERVAANFEKDILAAVDIVLALPDGDEKMELLHVSFIIRIPQICD